MKIKVCGLLDNDTGNAIAELQEVDFIGFIFAPQSPRFTEQTVSSSGKERVGVFVNASLEEIKATIEKHQLTIVQLHGTESPECCAALWKKIPVIKAFGIASPEDLLSVSAYEGYVDYFLFDTKSPQYGGTGVSFDWNLLHHYTGKTPFFLSGGISPESVIQLRDFQHPQCIGLDLNSRFENSPGVKDPLLIQTFIQSLNA